MSDEADLLFRGDWLHIRAMRRRNGRCPAKEWVDGLGKKGTALFHVAATITETNIRSGRPGDRAEKIKTSTEQLWELKVTKPGSSPPHLRILFVREGDTFWATHGFTKTKNRLPQSEIEEAERITAEWRAGR